MNWRRFIVQLLPPQSCALCSATAGNNVCDACCADLPWLEQDRLCPVCASLSPAGLVCGDCLKTPPAFYRTLSLLEYRFPVSQLVSRLKYRQHLPLANWFAEQFLLRMPPAGEKIDALIPVPLHPNRLKERGFNQSQLISRQLAKRLGTAHLPQLVERSFDTSQQAGLSRTERQRNMRNVFTCRENMSGLRLAIVDDVITTGSTADSLSRTLLDAGAAAVEVWSIARTH